MLLFQFRGDYIRNSGTSDRPWTAESKNKECERSLLLPLSGTCYNRRVRIAAERDAPW